MHQNEIDVLGLKIMEPMVAFSDLVITAVCFYFFLMMRKKTIKNSGFQWFRMYFFLMGLAILCGGLLGHAFLYAFSFNAKLFGWVLSCISNFLLQRAAIEYISPRIQKKVYFGINIFNILLCIIMIVLVLVPSTSGLQWVLLHTGLSLIGYVLPVFVYSWFVHRIKGSLWIVGAVTWAILTGIVNAANINLHQWFNHYVLAHVLMTIFFIILYRGVILVNESEKQ